MTTNSTLDRSAGIAVWRQIMETLKAEIVSGAFEKGSRLPPESSLQAGSASTATQCAGRSPR